MLQIWKWISTGAVVYGKVDGVDLPIRANDNANVNVISPEGVVILRCTQGELRKLASFQGYTTP